MINILDAYTISIIIVFHNGECVAGNSTCRFGNLLHTEQKRALALN